MSPQPSKRRKLQSQDIKSSDDGSEVSALQDSEGIVPQNCGNIRDSQDSRMRPGPRPPFKTDRALLSHSIEADGSSLFDFQVSELLLSVQPRYDRMTELEKTLHKLKQIIEEAEEREPLSFSEAKRIQEKVQQVRVPFPDVQSNREVKYKLAFSKPASVDINGGFARRTAINVRDELTVDLVVQMPSHLFQEKDYLNYRYFNKRAYYLACIATAIQENRSCQFMLEYQYQDDNPLQPILVVKSSDDNSIYDFRSKGAKIKVVLTASDDLFPPIKTLPTNNCLRVTQDNSHEGLGTISSPFYNATIRSECSSLVTQQGLCTASAQSAAFRAACVLGSIWLLQRGLDTSLSEGGFGALEWACTMALLLEGGDRNDRPVLFKKYTAFQMFKATLRFLAATNLAELPVAVMHRHLDSSKVYSPCLFDGKRSINILFKMSPWSYNILRHAAARTMEMFNEPMVEHFESCFIQRLDFQAHKYDYFAQLPHRHVVIDQAQALTNIHRDGHGLSRLHEVLQKGLGDRVALIDIRNPPSIPWKINAAEGPQSDPGKLSIRLVINAKNAYRLMDKGPSAEEKTASQRFRDFWGAKAELRRFKDGSIVESLIWSTIAHTGSIISQIITHLLSRHFSENAAIGIEVVCDGSPWSSPHFDQVDLHDPLKPFRSLLSSFEAFKKDTRALEGLPLQIRQMSAVDPQLSYTSLKRLGFGNASDHANVCIQFEGSSRWPDDLHAIQRSKVAFLLKMGELLESAVAGLSTRLGLENTVQSLRNFSFLDVHYPTGINFRVRLHVEHEKYLIEKEVSVTAKSTIEREAAAYALSAYKRDFIQAPLHTQSVSTLCTRFPLLSPCIRLFKTWRDCHLLSTHISDQLSELLVIRTFLHPGPFSIPGSIASAFFRTLLFVSKWDWRFEPLMIDISGDMTKQDIEVIKTRFKAWRSIDPAMNKIAMFAASNFDPNGITWTEQGPSKVAALRFTSLAKAATSLVQEHGFDLEAESLFAASTSDYDFTIHLKPKYVNSDGGQQAESTKFKNLRIETNPDHATVGFDFAASFLRELEILLGNNAILFWNANGGNLIGGLWNRMRTSYIWRVDLDFSSSPVFEGNRENTEATINRTGTLNDIARLGGDMIQRIEVKS